MSLLPLVVALLALGSSIGSLVGYRRAIRKWRYAATSWERAASRWQAVAELRGQQLAELEGRRRG
jgi:kynureninase